MGQESAERYAVSTGGLYMCSVSRGISNSNYPESVHVIMSTSKSRSCGHLCLPPDPLAHYSRGHQSGFVLAETI